jgi:hypothetical protein
MGLEQIGVELVAKNYDQFLKAIEGSHKATSNFNETLQGLSKVGGTIVAAGLAVGAAAVTGFTAYLVDSVKAAGESEEIQAKLAAVIKSTGGAAGVTAEQVNSLAQAAMSATKFDDDMVVSGENLLLTFTNIGKDVFPDTTKVMLDMSEALGQDLKSSAIQLGKALNDPVKGITALSRVGVSFTEDQKKMIAAMVDAGNVEGAQKVILAELNREFGGAAEAAGRTLPGQLTILKNKFDDIGKSIGGKLLPPLTDLVTAISKKLTDPQIQEAIGAIGDGIADFVKKAANDIPKVVDGFKGFVDFLKNNQGIIVGILAALGVAVASFFYTSASAALAAAPEIIAATWPILAVMAAVGAAAYLIYTAWTQNWGGIQEKAAAVWAYLQPIFASIVEWFQVNIPIAIAAVSNWWTNTLVPAMQAVGNWITTVLVPIFQKIWDWLATNIPIAIATVVNFWNGTLLPAFQAVGTWIMTVLVPIFQNMWNWLATNIPAAIQTVVNFWNNSFMPAVTAVWNFLSVYIIPMFTALAALIMGAVKLAFDVIVGVFQHFVMPALQLLWAYITNNIMPILTTLAGFVSAALKGAFEGFSNFITAVFNVVMAKLSKDFDDFMIIAKLVEHFVGTILLGAFNGLKMGIFLVTDAIQAMADRLKSIDKDLPSWLRPGSPTPFEIGLVGIDKAMKELTQSELPKFSAGLSLTVEPSYATSRAAQYRAMGAGGGSSTTDARSYNLGMNTNLSTDSVSQGFEYFKMMGA